VGGVCEAVSSPTSQSSRDNVGPGVCAEPHSAEPTEVVHAHTPPTQAPLNRGGFDGRAELRGGEGEGAASSGAALPVGDVGVWWCAGWCSTSGWLAQARHHTGLASRLDEVVLVG
jgi:hypothetical protein